MGNAGCISSTVSRAAVQHHPQPCSHGYYYGCPFSEILCMSELAAMAEPHPTCPTEVLSIEWRLVEHFSQRGQAASKLR